MSESTAERNEPVRRPPRRFLTTILCGYSSMIVVTVVLLMPRTSSKDAAHSALQLDGASR